MSYIVWEDEMNKLLNVTEQLKLFADMADQARELKLTGEGLGCFMRRLADEVGDVAATADERRSLGKKNRVSPSMPAQIIATVGGLRPILGGDMNRITNRLRACAEADEDMRAASTVWEELLTASGGRALTTLEGFYIQFDKMQASSGAPEVEK